MVFGKKKAKKTAKGPDTDVKTSVIDAPSDESLLPPPQAQPTPPEAPLPPPPTPEEALQEENAKLRYIIDSFAADYDGVVPQGSDLTRANILFAIYGELKVLNANIVELLEIAERE